MFKNLLIVGRVEWVSEGEMECGQSHPGEALHVLSIKDESFRMCRL